MQQQWSEVLPFYFKVLIIINVLSFKTHLHYLNKQERTPSYVRILLLILYSTATILLFAFPLIDSNPAISDSSVQIFNLVAMLSYLIPLSIASLFAFFKLQQSCFQAEQFKGIRIKMIWLEVLI